MNKKTKGPRNPCIIFTKCADEKYVTINFTGIEPAEHLPSGFLEGDLCYYLFRKRIDLNADTIIIETLVIVSPELKETMEIRQGEKIFATEKQKILVLMQKANARRKELIEQRSYAHTGEREIYKI